MSGGETTNGVADTPTPAPFPGYLTADQVSLLLKELHPNRINPDNGRGFPHVRGADVRATLIRIIGFCRWSAELLEQHLVFDEQENGVNERTGKPYKRWYVAYRSRVQLTIHAPDGQQLAVYTSGAVNGAHDPERDVAHDHAAKASETGALKKAATNLGDQFGLGLSLDRSRHTVRVTFVHPAAGTEVDPLRQQQVYTAGLPEPVTAPVAAAVLEALRAHATAPEARLDALRTVWKQASGSGDLDRYLHLDGPEPPQHLRTYLAAHMSAALHLMGTAGDEEQEVSGPVWGCRCDPERVVSTGAHEPGCGRGGEV